MTQPKADDTLQELMAKMAEHMEHIKMVGEEGEGGVNLPLTINSIRFVQPMKQSKDFKVGTYVPDLDRVVWGYESWWGVIKGPEELKEITDEDIQNVWYVKAMKQMSEREGGE
jgi:hypothetical protein